MRFILITAAIAVAACGGDGSTANGTPAPPGPTLTPIYDVQGSGPSSALSGEDVTVEGVVTGDFQDGDVDDKRNLGGFYMQNAPDADAGTSDGVFVYDGSNPPTDVSVGELVRITGTVDEYFGETQVSASTVTVIGTGTIDPLPINFPVATTTNSDGELIADLESYEGMLVTFSQTLTVSQLRNLERYGEVLLSEGGREFSYTNLNAPDVAGYAAHVNSVRSRRIRLDDGLLSNNSATPLTVRNGDDVTNVTGVVRYSRGSGSSGTEAYRLMPTIDPEFDNVNPRPDFPNVGGSLRIATVNLNNFFSTVDSGQQICGPAGNAACRGADSDEELSRQIAKVVIMLETIDADVFAMIELENNDSESLQTIVDSLNASVGLGTYDFIDTGTIGTDAIKVGYLYQPASVHPAGTFAILDSSVDVRFIDSRNRPVLAQSFDTVADADRFTVLALHLKSKARPCDSDGDPDLGDGQSDCSATRSLAAAAMIDWIATDPTSSGSDDYLVMGDFNTHTMGDAMEQFEIAGFVNLASSIIGESAYSFEFDGQFGSLDHAAASPSLATRVVDVAEWHINADEAAFHDYNLDFGRDPALFDPATPYRATDHDPLIIGIEFSP